MRRQLELMREKGYNERRAFKAVQEEAASSGELVDAAVNLCVTNAQERATLLASLPDYEKQQAGGFNQHVKEIAANVTDAYVTDVMKAEGLSRTAGENQAMKQREYDRRRAFEKLRRHHAQQGAPQSSHHRRSKFTAFSRRTGVAAGPRSKPFADPFQVASQSPRQASSAPPFRDPFKVATDQHTEEPASSATAPAGGGAADSGKAPGGDDSAK